MNKSEMIDELAAALATAQGQIKNAAKDSQNPFFKSAYADLASVRDAINKVFSEQGLAVTQLLSNDANGVTVETVLLHKSGQWLSGMVSVKPIKDDPQALGSAVTYARRYSLSAIAGIASEIDDDGEAAMGRQHKQDLSQAKPAESKANTTPPATKPTSTPAPAGKIETSRVISGRKVAAVKTPKGKQSRITLEGDDTVYILGKGEPEVKPGETITADCILKETTSGVAFYELTNTAPY